MFRAEHKEAWCREMFWSAVFTSRVVNKNEFSRGVFSKTTHYALMFVLRRYYQVIVRELATDNRNKPVPLEEPDSYKPEDLYTYHEARRKKPDLVPYIAVQFPAREFDRYENFVVGAGTKGSSEAKRRRRRRVEDDGQEYYNGPLEENTFYAVFQRAYVSEVSSVAALRCQVVPWACP